MRRRKESKEKADFKEHQYPIGYFFRYFLNFEPADQGISLKGYEKKTVTFKTIEDKYLSARGGGVSLRNDCGANEKFFTEVLGDRIVFRTHDRRYLSAADGQIILSPNVDSTSKFRLLPAPHGSKFSNYIGIQTNMKTYFTYLRGQNIVTHAKNYGDSCLFDIEASDIVDEDGKIEETKRELKPFPESSDELMLRYEETGYLGIREKDSVPANLFCVLCMAKLEALALTEAPAE
eukprot:1344278-Amorphochlora_amoeboformis.AAC.1